jgi:hypothetical protein
MDKVTVDLKNRDDDFTLSVAELKRVIQAQKVLERDALNEYAAVSSFWLNRPMSKFCTPGLRM